MKLIPSLVVTFALGAVGLANPPPPANVVVKPPPSGIPPGRVLIQPPPPAPILFGGGVRVYVYPTKFVIHDAIGHTHIVKRPLPDVARNPNGCGYVKNYLDTHDCHSQSWLEMLNVYLFKCRGLR